MAARIAGRYELGVELARGGMGVVYRGRDLHLDQEVAIKVMLPVARTDPVLVERFQREALAMGRVEHPALVRVRDAGVDFGRPFLVMDLVEGETLRQVLRRSGFGYREAAQLVVQLAEALDAVHAAGVLHRDVKPDNILLDTDRRPRLTDFGVGKLLDESHGTSTGTILGSPVYISPEQANGELDSLGPGADVYGLGATFYELLTGHPPFSGTTVISILNAVLTETPRPVRELAPSVPAELAAICERCLAKTPRERYRTAGALAMALKTKLEAPLSSERKSLREEAAATGPPARSGPPALAILVGAVALVGGVLAGAWRAGGSAPSDPAVQPSDPSASVSSIWSEILPRPLHPVRAATLPGRLDLPSSMRQGSLLGMKALGQPETAREFYERAAVRLGAGKTEQALSDLDQALALDPGHKSALALAAQLHWELGRGRETAEDLGRLIHRGLPLPQQRTHLVERAYVYLQAGQLDWAARDAQQALHDGASARARRMLLIEGLAHQILGGVQLRRGRFAAARAELEQGLELYPDHTEGLVELLYALAGLGVESGPDAVRRLRELVERGLISEDGLVVLRIRLRETGDSARELDAAGVARPD